MQMQEHEEFFSVRVCEDTNTVDALDDSGAVVVSLHFEDLDDLCSESFRMFLKQAWEVTVAGQCASEQIEPCETQSSCKSMPKCAVPLQTNEPDGANGTECVSKDNIQMKLAIQEDNNSMMKIWEQEMRLLEGEKTRKLLEQEEAERVLHRDQMDADLALALKLQIDEEEIMSRSRINGNATMKKKSAWGEFSSETFVYVDGTKPLGRARKSIQSISQEEYPELPATLRNRKNGEATESISGRHCGGQNLKNATDGETIAGKKNNARVVQKQESEEDDFFTQIAMNDWYIKERENLDTVLEKKLNSQERKSIIHSVLEEGQESPDQGHKGRKKFISPTSMKKMMVSVQKQRCTSELKDEDEEETTLDRDKYCRKNIRKLVLDMIEAGWKPLPGRGGGHYVYERHVTLASTGQKHRQLMVLPCTPSDRRSIDVVYAKLMKFDREALEL